MRRSIRTYSARSLNTRLTIVPTGSQWLSQRSMPCEECAMGGWTKGASELTGKRFADFQVALTHYNAARFRPALPEEAPRNELAREQAVARAEIEFIEAQRAELGSLAADISDDPDGFIAWFEQLKST